jgi:putative transcriptional regulator
MAIVINVDVMLAKRKMSVTALAEKGRHHDGEYLYIEKRQSEGDPFIDADAICCALKCQPGDILEYRD